MNVNVEDLTYKSLQNFHLPEEFEQYIIADNIFFDTNIDDFTAAQKIFEFVQKNPRNINIFEYIDTPLILESRKACLNDIMKAHGFGYTFNIKTTFFIGIHSAVAHDYIEFLKEHIDFVKEQDLDTDLIDVACKFGSIKCYKFLKLNGANCSAEAIKYSMESGNFEIIMDLYNNGANPSHHFQYAIDNRKYNIADWILENYSEVEFSANACIKANNIRAACFCFKNKLPFSAANFQRLCFYINQESFVTYLLDMSSDKLIDEVYEYNCYYYFNVNILKGLTMRGYNMNRIVNNNCPLLLAGYRRDNKLYRFLIDHGAVESRRLVHHINLNLEYCVTIWAMR